MKLGRRFADTAQHRRCRLERHVQNLMQVERPYRLGSALGEIDGLQPLVGGDVAGTHQRAMQAGEGLAADIALVGADASGRAVQLADLAGPAAAWADHPVGPQQTLEITMCAQLVRERP